MIALGLLVVGIMLLLIGADWFIDGAVDLARAFRVSALVLGVILVGLEPEEMLTAAIASARGAPALAVGDVVGTNVTIVTVALGLSALIWPIVFGHSIRRQAVIATLVSLVPVVLLFTGSVSRLAGAFLLALFVGYTVFLLRTDRAAFKRMAEADDDDEEEVETVQGVLTNMTKVPWKSIAFTLGGLFAMAIGGPAVVEGSLQLAQLAGLSQGVVGATIVSLGTGAEMIALGINAARKRRPDILVGGILGSFAYNLLVTLGLAAVIRPIVVEPQLTRVAVTAMILVYLALLALIWYGKMNRLMGGLFVAAYAVYLVSIVLLH
jgi:cation:H+ antiporter